MEKYQKEDYLLLMCKPIRNFFDFDILIHNVIVSGIIDKIQNKKELAPGQIRYWDKLIAERNAMIKEGQSATWYRYGNIEVIQTTMLEQ